MKTYFVVSDCHSFYTEMMDALKEKEFSINNPDHILLSIGDMFDRGLESKKMLDFLYDLNNKGRLIYVRGNHEDLMIELLKKQYPESYDYSNGTVQTLIDLQTSDDTKVNNKTVEPYMSKLVARFDKRYLKLYDTQINFYETDQYIFTHGWIPFIEKKGKFIYDPNWRNEKESNWKNIWRWENGMDCWKQGVKEPNKTIVCGHWHCSYGWSHIDRKYKEFPNPTHEDFQYSFKPYYNSGIIAIDGCTAYSKKVNVLRFEEDEL